MKKQVLKSGLLEFAKGTKGNTDNIYIVYSDKGQLWIYNGFILNTKTFNLNYAVVHNKVKATQLDKNTVYTINTEGVQGEQRKVFGLKEIV